MGADSEDRFFDFGKGFTCEVKVHDSGFYLRKSAKSAVSTVDFRLKRRSRLAGETPVVRFRRRSSPVNRLLHSERFSPTWICVYRDRIGSNTIF